MTAVIIMSSIPILGIVLILLLINMNLNRGGFLSRVKQRQMIARMIYSAQLFETKRKQSKNGRTSKDKIIFPKIYYRFHKDSYLTDLTFPLNGGRYHDRFLKLGKTLEEMFVADLIEEGHEVGFITYTLLVDVCGNRISIEDVKVNETSLNLMKGVTWDFTKSPHLLVAGGTGGGKTYFLFSLIYKLMQIGTVDICDPKEADLYDLKDLPAFKGHVFTGTEWITRCLQNASKEMMERYRYMKTLPNYVSGQSYSYYGLPPHFVIVDEWTAFATTLDFQEKIALEKEINQLVLKARQAGVFLILAMQRPDAEYLPGGVRDNMMYKITLGSMGANGYRMMFGDEHKNKSFFNKKIRGRGYVSDSGAMPQEFYSPLIKKDFNFMTEFGKFKEMITLKMD